MKERRQVVIQLENKVSQREEALNNRSVYLDKREESISNKEQKLEERKEQLEQLNSKMEIALKEQETKLQEISNLSVDQAREIIMKRVEDSMADEIANFIREEEDKAKVEVQNRAKLLMANAMQKYASETTTERTVTVVDIPNDDMKGRIIGRRP